MKNTQARREPMKIPFHWKMRWFAQGFASVFGFRVSKEQREKEANECLEEMVKLANQDNLDLRYGKLEDKKK